MSMQAATLMYAGICLRIKHDMLVYMICVYYYINVIYIIYVYFHVYYSGLFGETLLAPLLSSCLYRLLYVKRA